MILCFHIEFFDYANIENTVEHVYSNDDENCNLRSPLPKQLWLHFAQHFFSCASSPSSSSPAVSIIPKASSRRLALHSATPIAS